MCGGIFNDNYQKFTVESYDKNEENSGVPSISFCGYKFN